MPTPRTPAADEPDAEPDGYYGQRDRQYQSRSAPATEDLRDIRDIKLDTSLWEREPGAAPAMTHALPL